MSTFGTAPDASIPASIERIVADGHGNEWPKCGRADCDLHVCRPGKSQCNHVDCPEAGPVARIVGLGARDPLTREQARHAITRDRLSGLVEALRTQRDAWRKTAADLDAQARAESFQTARQVLQAHASRARICAADLSVMLDGLTGTLPDDGAEALPDDGAEALADRGASR